MSDKKGNDEIYKAIGYLIIMCVVGFWVYGKMQESEEIEARNRNKLEQQIATLQATPFRITQNVQNGSQLHQALSDFSKMTEVQRNDTIKKYRGDLVGVETKVKNIERDDNTYTIKTTTFIGIDYELEVYPTSEENERYITSLHKGDTFRFLGFIHGTNWLDDLFIKPAIVISSSQKGKRNQSSNNTFDPPLPTATMTIKLSKCERVPHTSYVIISGLDKHKLNYYFQGEIDWGGYCDALKIGKRYNISFVGDIGEQMDSSDAKEWTKIAPAK